MGYRPSRKIYNLEFEDYPGLEVKCTSTSFGTLMELASIKVQLGEKDREKLLELFNKFAECLTSWNVEHPDLTEDEKARDRCTQCGFTAGDPLPPTLQSILCLDLDLTMQIIFGWMMAVARASLPKGTSLNDGGPNGPEQQLMMQLAELQSLAR